MLVRNGDRRNEYSDLTEKSSQAKDLRAALGDRFGQILPAEGHLVRLAEPEEVNTEWKRWSCTLLKPDGLYPTRPAADGNKLRNSRPSPGAQNLRSGGPGNRLRPRRAAPRDPRPSRLPRPRAARPVYRSGPKNLAQAFAQLKPNGDLRPLCEAALARPQADQSFNLSLTRTAMKTLLSPGVRGVIGIGRVKTPTLGIVCLRELEIRNFRPEDYFEIVATATVAAGSFHMGHAPAANRRITDRPRAEVIARRGGRQGAANPHDAGPVFERQHISTITRNSL